MPWQGKATLTFESEMKGQLRLRIPQWAEGFRVSVNGQPVKYKRERGYAIVSRSWKKGDAVNIEMPMQIRMLEADPRVKEDVGQRAVQRGPLIYCAEEVDNPQHFDEIALSPSTKWTDRYVPKLRGIVELKATEGSQTFTLIPYYAWDNRLAGEMRVWMPWKEGQ